MKIIKLHTINFLDWQGIILNDDNPSVEASNDNVEKLSRFIENGMLRMYDPEIDGEYVPEGFFEDRKPYMDPVENPFTNGEYVLTKDNTLTSRIPEETEEEVETPEEAVMDLSKMKKAELEEHAKSLGIEIPNGANKKEIIELIENKK